MVLTEYITLIQAFVEEEITAKDFEREYLNLFKSETRYSAEPIFRILERLFFDVDDYWEESTEDDEARFIITEATLRRYAAQALVALQQLV